MNTEIDLKKVEELIKVINKEGKKKGNKIDFPNIFCDLGRNNKINFDLLDRYNEGITYKELLSRYLYLSCVLDQGPDIEGIHFLLREITNELYSKGKKFIHDPQKFFNNILEILNIIEKVHQKAKMEYGIGWKTEKIKNKEVKKLIDKESCNLFGKEFFKLTEKQKKDVYKKSEKEIDKLLLNIKKAREKDRKNFTDLLLRERDRKEEKEYKKLFSKLCGEYSLFDQSRICPSIMFRIGTPLLIIKRLIDDGKSLLGWVKSWKHADKVVEELKRNEKYGLGKAIGDKASRLFAKNIINIYKLIDEPKNPKWDDNSYQSPIDSNVGRVLMRSGYVFYFIPENLFVKKCCRKQKGERWNLGANRMRDIKIHPKTSAKKSIGLRKYKKIDKNFLNNCSNLASSWGSKSKVILFPMTLNVFVKMLKDQGEKSSIGIIDDGLMRIGTNYCDNTNPDCDKCPLNKICIAFIQESELIRKYYCGTGEGIFY